MLKNLDLGSSRGSHCGANCFLQHNFIYMTFAWKALLVLPVLLHVMSKLIAFKLSSPSKSCTVAIIASAMALPVPHGSFDTQSNCSMPRR
jgi:hypothetical protein